MATTTIVDRLMRTRWLSRSPIAIFRARLGFLFGGRLLLLEHKGRTSGQWRSAVLEVVEHPAPDVIHVVAGLGPQSQWYRNVMADPRTIVSIGTTHRTRALATPISPADGVEVLNRYAREHATAWAKLRGMVEAWATEDTAPGRDWREAVPVIELRLIDGASATHTGR